MSGLCDVTKELQEVIEELYELKEKERTALKRVDALQQHIDVLYSRLQSIAPIDSYWDKRKNEKWGVRKLINTYF